MIDFIPRQLNRVKDQLLSRFPLPSDYALAEKTVVFDMLERVRGGNGSFLELSVTEWHYVYQLADVCSEPEYAALETMFASRMTKILFDIGWIYCQWHPNHHRAIALFLEACRWMQTHYPEAFDVTLMGRVGISWEDIYTRAVEIMRIDKLSMEEFCRSYHIDTKTPFYEGLQLTYLSECSREVLLEQEQLLGQLISTADIELLRPLIRNYVAKIPYEEMPQLINDAISYRLAKEDSQETLGLSPLMLQRIRSLRFSGILESCVNPHSEKLTLYNQVAGMIRSVELLTASYYVMDFGSYMVLDNSDWKSHAYAYLPNVFEDLMEQWKAKQYAEDFWPGFSKSDIISAREVVLGLKKANVIHLGFEAFDKLYTKDILSITRYTMT